MILVPSIPHTGTHFVRDHLLRDCPIPVKCEHIFHNSRVDLGRISGQWNVTTIVPIRHPLAVVASWRSRGKSIDALPQYFDDLVEHIAPTNPFYLPLDVAGARDAWLETLNGHLSVFYDFVVDAAGWPVLRDEGARAAGHILTGRELEVGHNIVLRHREFLADFYPSLRQGVA